MKSLEALKAMLSVFGVGQLITWSHLCWGRNVLARVLKFYMYASREMLHLKRGQGRVHVTGENGTYQDSCGLFRAGAVAQAAGEKRRNYFVLNPQTDWDQGALHKKIFWLYIFKHLYHIAPCTASRGGVCGEASIDSRLWPSLQRKYKTRTSLCLVE